MDVRLLKVAMVRSAPRFRRRKRARFLARAFYTREVFLAVLLAGVVIGLVVGRGCPWA